MKVLDKDKLVDFMDMRKMSLDSQITRDFTGGMQSRIFEQREVKYWKEAIERGEFDSTIPEVYIILSKDSPEIVDFTFYINEESVKKRVDELNSFTQIPNFWYLTMFSNARNGVNMEKSGTKKF